MPRPQSSSSATTLQLRIAAAVVLFLAVTICGLQVLGAITAMDHPETAGPIPAMFIAPLMTFAAGVGLSGLLEGISRLLARPAAVQTSAVGGEKLTAAVTQLQATLPGMFDELRRALEQSHVVAEPMESPPAESTTGLYLERVVKLLEEMKELSMLDDSQRQQRRVQVMDRRKTSRLEEAARLMHHGEWGEADSLLHLLESLHPGDPEVLACRNELDDARTETQTLEWENLGAQVEELVARGNYDGAIATSTQFLEKFPAHADCQLMLERLEREKAIVTERRSTALYEQIRTAVETRQWRSALEGIQQFLDQFPQHPRAEKIRLQVRVIQKNAEIEERHELENRIREMVSARQYNEAVTMSEDLLHRFPESAQAAHLAEILPKLRERASAEVSGSVFLG